tara:strand:+ start:45 stop:341 length:297 start_codon:yes stop_codon:yes gene_type:complete
MEMNLHRAALRALLTPSAAPVRRASASAGAVCWPHNVMWRLLWIAAHAQRSARGPTPNWVTRRAVAKHHTYPESPKMMIFSKTFLWCWPAILWGAGQF